MIRRLLSRHGFRARQVYSTNIYLIAIKPDISVCSDLDSDHRRAHLFIAPGHIPGMATPGGAWMDPVRPAFDSNHSSSFPWPTSLH
jgi:hypothetical protein